MNRIKKLDYDTISRICAGEVILRPSNVIKELIENSIDASSDFIEVEIRKGGKEYIRVTDNGVGIMREDLSLAVERFTTSKLKRIDDLERLTTLGFRGEALASIAAVSKLTIITSKSGRAYKMEVIDHQRSKIIDTAAPDGTTVIVQDLFYNIPVRRKFLKTEQTETLAILEVFTRYVLSCPHIHFRLIINSRINQEHFAQKDHLPRVISVLGENNMTNMLKQEASSDSIDTIFIGSNFNFSKSNQKYIYTFVNSRFVNDRMLKRAIMEAYSRILPPQRYPVAVLFLSISPSEVDINVHPQKIEIRFRDPLMVYRTILQQITEFTIKLRPTGEIDKTEQIPLSDPDRQRIINIRENTTFSDYQKRPDQLSKQYTSGLPDSNNIFREEGYFSSLEILGQFQDRFIILKSRQSIVIVDQHAAQERILYNKIIKNMQNRSTAIQRLLIPLNIELNPIEMARLRLLINEMSRIGFEIEIFGEHNAIIKGIPSAITGGFSEKTFIDILNWSDDESFRLGTDVIIEEIAARTACHASIRGSHRLNDIETRRLLVEMDKTDLSIVCPHGRPVFFEISTEEIEKRFMRK